MPAAFVFPGQGSQKVGMGAELAQTRIGHELFERAEASLSLPLRRLCLEGPDDQLSRTENTQPALYVVSAIAAVLLKERGWRPQAMAGHSLGEYSALHAAGALAFEDGLRVVRRRGELMATVGDRVSGGMAAILGLAPTAVADVCAEVTSRGEGTVEPANFNSPEQTVISGESPALEQAMELAKSLGAKRALKLNVAAPFHSRLMAPLAEEMRGVLAAVEIRTPEVPVIANVTATPVQAPDEIRRALVEQMAGSVRWVETLLYLESMGISRTVEVGSGRVLTGLTPRICAGMAAIDTAEAIVADPVPAD